MLIDPLTQIGMKITSLKEDEMIDDKVHKVLQDILRETRENSGNRTWYIQQLKSTWTLALELWKSFYEIKVKNGYIGTKTEACKLIT